MMKPYCPTRSEVLAVLLGRSDFLFRLADDAYEWFGETIVVELVGMNASTRVIQHFVDHYPVCIHAQNSYGLTALHYAIDLGRIDLVMYLITKGADVNAPDACGHTPLQVAVSHMNYPLTRILYYAGASLKEQPNAFGSTFYEYLSPVGSVNTPESDRLIRFLVRRGDWVLLRKSRLNKQHIGWIDHFTLEYYFSLLQKVYGIRGHWLFEPKVFFWIKKFF